ncbi:MAG: cupin [Candidatus Dadabacteria bacterium]|nr:cupin [Candidatus Dadabacteria bacterium]NIQ16612.1 cupin [Candidatus Dadabacteria bacterium]
MPKLIDSPSLINAAGTKPKKIEEFVGVISTSNEDLSVAKMISPEGWEEPGQTPEFQEITVVLKGLLKVEHSEGSIEVKEGQAIITYPGEWVRYSTPADGGAEYIAICLPAFSPDTVHRDS